MIAEMTQTQTEPGTQLQAQGLTLRMWRDDADFEAMSKVIIASRNADQLEETRDAAELKLTYVRMKNIDLPRDLFLVEDAGVLVAYGACRWWEERGNKFVHGHWIFVLPEYRGRGIENELLRILQARLREVAQVHPADATRVFESFTMNTQEWFSRILIEDGFQPERYFYDMLCDDLSKLPDVELPEGIETRPVNPEDIRRIYDAEGEAFLDHWGEALEDESDYDRWLKNPKWNPALWQVAWDGDQVVGMVLSYVNETENERYHYKRGYTENISVRKPWRKRGIASALLVKSMKMFRDMGFDQTALGVDTENETGALRVYTNVGYKPIRTETVYRRPMD